MDENYWKSRCEAAESALRRARSALPRHKVRKAVIEALSDLKPDETLPTGAVAAKLSWTRHRAIYVLLGMQRVGLVDRTHPGRGGGRGNSVTWKLGHLVQAEASEQ